MVWKIITKRCPIVISQHITFFSFSHLLFSFQILQRHFNYFLLLLFKPLLNLLQYCLFYVLVLWPQGMWDLSSLTRDWTHIPCIGRRSLNHWTARSVPSFVNPVWKKKSSGSQTLALPQSPRELVKIHIFKVWEFKILTSSQSMLMVPVWGPHSNTMALSYNTTHLWRLFSPFGDFISLLMSQHRYRWMISERQLQ